MGLSVGQIWTDGSCYSQSLMFHSFAGFFAVSKLDSNDGDDGEKKQDHICISILFMTFLSVLS